MRLQRYRFEQVVQEVTVKSVSWLQEEFKAILEANRPYEKKCDYLGYSILSIDEKIAVLDEQIKELQGYKKRLKEAKALVIETGASVFASYGISKIEGGGISSITVSKPKHQITSQLKVDDATKLIEAGFYKKSLDETAVLDAYHSGQYKDLIESCCSVVANERFTPAKLKINKRRGNHGVLDEAIGEVA